MTTIALYTNLSRVSADLVTVKRLEPKVTNVYVVIDDCEYYLDLAFNEKKKSFLGMTVKFSYGLDLPEDCDKIFYSDALEYFHEELIGKPIIPITTGAVTNILDLLKRSRVIYPGQHPLTEEGSEGKELIDKPIYLDDYTDCKKIFDILTCTKGFNCCYLRDVRTKNEPINYTGRDFGTGKFSSCYVIDITSGKAYLVDSCSFSLNQAIRSCKSYYSVYFAIPLFQNTCRDDLHMALACYYFSKEIK